MLKTNRKLFQYQSDNSDQQSSPNKKYQQQNQLKRKTIQKHNINSNPQNCQIQCKQKQVFNSNSIQKEENWKFSKENKNYNKYRLNNKFQNHQISTNFMIPKQQETFDELINIAKPINANSIQSHLKSFNQYNLKTQQKKDQQINIGTSLSCIKSINIGKINLQSSDQQQENQISSIQHKTDSNNDTPISIRLDYSEQECNQSNIKYHNLHNIPEDKSDHHQKERKRSTECSNDKINKILSKLSIKSIDIKSTRQFVYNLIPQNQILKLTLKRDKSGLNRFWPQYDVLFSENCKHFLSFKRKSGNTTPNYTISLDKNDFDKGPHILGKVRSNFAGSVFSVFDRGANPNKASSNQTVRRLLATIVFNKSDMAKVGPRQFEVYCLKNPYSYWDLEGVSMLNEQCPLNKLYEIKTNKQKIVVFKNRKPVWNKKIQGYIMDFGGRIDKASVKNFILQDEKHQQVLMFGRLGDDIFTFDISYPLNPLIGVSIVIANFQSKITCE